MLLNCGIGGDSWESLGLQGDPTSSSSRRSVLSVHWKDLCWSWNSNTLATWCEELTHLKWPWCWVRLKAGGEGADRGWDGWMASPTQWTWVCVGSGSWWTGRPGVLQSMELQRVGHDWVTELNWVKIFVCKNLRLSLMKGIYYKATRVAVREMGPHKTVTARSQERNGSWASSMIYRAHSRRKGPLGFKTALGNKYYFMATHWQFFSFLLSSLWFCYSA